MKLKLILSLLVFSFGFSLKAQVLSNTPAKSKLISTTYQNFYDDFSEKNLKKIAESQGPGMVGDFFGSEMEKIVQNASKLPVEKNGLRDLSPADQTLLIIIVKRAQFITDEIDKGNIHYGGLVKLYQALPRELKRAIKNSILTRSQQAGMLESLENLQSISR